MTVTKGHRWVSDDDRVICEWCFSSPLDNKAKLPCMEKDK